MADTDTPVSDADLSLREKVIRDLGDPRQISCLVDSDAIEMHNGCVVRFYNGRLKVNLPQSTRGIDLAFKKKEKSFRFFSGEAVDPECPLRQAFLEAKEKLIECDHKKTRKQLKEVWQ